MTEVKACRKGLSLPGNLGTVPAALSIPPLGGDSAQAGAGDHSSHENSCAKEILRQLYTAGAKLRVEGETLWVTPKQVVTERLRAAITARKAEIIRILTLYNCSRCGWGVFPEPTVCYHCRKAIAELESEAYAEDVLRTQEADNPSPRKKKAAAKKASAA